RNLERKCEDFFERERLRGMLSDLDPEYLIGLVPLGAGAAGSAAESAVSAPGLDDEALRRLLGQFATAKEFLFLGRRFGRDDQRLGGPGFEALARDALAVLLPIYCFIAWTRDNDFVSMREMLKQEKQAKKQKHLAKNDRIRIVRGMLAGKVGVVQELD